MHSDAHPELHSFGDILKSKLLVSMNLPCGVLTSAGTNSDTIADVRSTKFGWGDKYSTLQLLKSMYMSVRATH